MLLEWPICLKKPILSEVGLTYHLLKPVLDPEKYGSLLAIVLLYQLICLIHYSVPAS